MTVQLQDTATAPQSPGVYRFWNTKHQVLYVGKASNIRKRLAQYRSGRESEQRINIDLLFRHTVEVDWIVTASEKEALILEDTLIKEHRPKYNIRMRDDKSYLHLRITTEHAYPRLVRIRRPAPGTTDLFGPYPSAFAVKQVMQVIHRVFPLRTCNDSKFNNRSRACLEHQIGRCSAPCVDRIQVSEYAALIEDVRRFIKGEDRTLLTDWRLKMAAASRNMDFETAARYRDLIQAAEQVWQKQTMDVRQDKTMDCIAVAFNETKMVFAVTGVTEGVIVSSKVLGPMAWQGDVHACIEQFVLQYYQTGEAIPEVLCLNSGIDELLALQDLLRDRRGKKVQLKHPQRGANKKRIDFCEQQATMALQGDSKAFVRMRAVERILKLETGSLDRIECFDISEHHGDHAVGGNVVFLYGEPAPDLYRRYKIKLDAGENDFLKMNEMLERRVRRAIKDRDMPDLLVVDGGKGQLNAALRAFRDLEVEPPAIVGLAKARAAGFQGRTESTQERLFLPGRANPIILKPGSPERLLFEHLRDETHNLAIGYHRSSRRTHVMKGLESVPGMGPKRRKKLLNAFSSLNHIQYESPKNIAETADIPLKVAEEVVQWLQHNDTNS